MPGCPAASSLGFAPGRYWRCCSSWARAAASGYLAFNANKKVAAIEIATEVVQGQPLTLADMQEEVDPRRRPRQLRLLGLP